MKEVVLKSQLDFHLEWGQRKRILMHLWMLSDKRELLFKGKIW